jgi:hypothetical protein
MEPFLESLALCPPCRKHFQLGHANYNILPQDKICPFCLNLNSNLQAFAQQVHSHFQSLQFSPPFKAYSVNLNLPICQSLRERLLFLLISKEFTAVNKTSFHLQSFKDLADAKKEYRRNLNAALTPLLGFSEGLVGDLQITISIKSEISEKLLNWLCSPSFKPYIPNKYRYRKSFVKMLTESRGVITEFLNNIPVDFLGDKLPEFVNLLAEINHSCQMDAISIVRNSIFIAGKYRKLSREISQTPWEEKFAQSVSGYIGGYLSAQTGAQGTSPLFHILNSDAFY